MGEVGGCARARIIKRSKTSAITKYWIERRESRLGCGDVLIIVQEQMEIVIKRGLVVGSGRKQRFQYVHGIKCIIGDGTREKKKQEE